mmetsp:Transcript_27380/g.89602  ORF Transcript_27380/g.89602 Transcript_27380/m.89602 type:complete len:269 (+) Transcript_27380:90-896(+)
MQGIQLSVRMPRSSLRPESSPFSPRASAASPRAASSPSLRGSMDEEWALLATEADTVLGPICSPSSFPDTPVRIGGSSASPRFGGVPRPSPAGGAGGMVHAAVRRSWELQSAAAVRAAPLALHCTERLSPRTVSAAHHPRQQTTDARMPPPPARPPQASAVVRADYGGGGLRASLEAAIREVVALGASSEGAATHEHHLFASGLAPSPAPRRRSRHRRPAEHDQHAPGSPMSCNEDSEEEEEEEPIRTGLDRSAAHGFATRNKTRFAP